MITISTLCGIVKASWWGLAGRESEILRRTLPVAVPLVIAAGVVALVSLNA
jgi:L-lactate permease